MLSTHDPKILIDAIIVLLVIVQYMYIYIYIFLILYDLYMTKTENKEKGWRNPLF